MEKSTFETTVCTHLFTEQCFRCWRKEKDDSALVSSLASLVTLYYIDKNTKLSIGQIAQLKAQNTKYVLDQRKLHLVLDLDHTLLHSIKLKNKHPDDVRDLLYQAENSLKGELFLLHSSRKIMKLRPFVRSFLEEANKLFNMYIYTRGTRRYAKRIACLLDPNGVYFGSRVIAKEDCTRPHQKGLDVVLGQESAVLILDDQERVWPDNKDNLILVKQYNYFSHKNSGGESDGTLALVLEVLKKIHKTFFSQYKHEEILEGDVRKVLKMVMDAVFGLGTC